MKYPLILTNTSETEACNDNNQAVSPYLNLPIRSLAQAQRDVARAELARSRPNIAIKAYAEASTIRRRAVYDGVM